MEKKKIFQIKCILKIKILISFYLSIYAHKNILTDFNFSPFKETDLLISSSVEDIVKIWKLKEHPEEPLIKGDLEIQHEISSSINRCGFHPKVKEIIYTSQGIH